MTLWDQLDLAIYAKSSYCYQPAVCGTEACRRQHKWYNEQRLILVQWTGWSMAYHHHTLDNQRAYKTSWARLLFIVIIIVLSLLRSSDGLLRRLQLVQNAVTRLVTCRRPSLWPHHTSVTAAALAASPSASRVQDHGRSLELLPRTSSTTVALCRTLVVAHCGPIPMTCGSCSCREQKFGDRSFSVALAGPRLGTIFHPDNGGRDCILRLLYTISEILSIWRPKGLLTLLNL